MELKSKFNVGDYAYYVGMHGDKFRIIYSKIDDINFGTFSSRNEDNYKIQYNITIYYSTNTSDPKSNYRVYNVDEDVLFNNEKDIIDYIKKQVNIVDTTVKSQLEKLLENQSKNLS